MSHNQSRGDRTKSGQYRKTGRSSSFNQQRHFSVGFKGGGGGLGGSSSSATPADPSISNRSSNVIQDWSHSVPAPVVQNGAQRRQPLPGVSDALVTSKSANVTPINAPAQRITQAVPRSPSSNISTAVPSTNASIASSDINSSATPAKATTDASSSFTLQFGSISPGFMNGMQIPARTSSASANLDEQKEDKACHDSLKSAPAVPTPTIPKHRLPKKDTRVLDQPNTGEAQPVSKSKRDAQVSAAPPSTQTQKLSVQPMAGMSVQMQFQQPQVPVQFGVPNPQIQSQATPTSSLPIPIKMGMSIPLLMENSPMFVQTPNAMQSQGLMHQGQNLNYSSQMGHQMPHQFGSMGINMAPQSPPQQAAKFTAFRKTVKITHGGLQRNNSPAQRITQAVPRSPSSNISTAVPSTNASIASSDINSSATPAKATTDASSSFTLQFGSISPGFMNGMQIPARTSSASANLDEQKEDKACHDSLKSAPAVPTPTILKHQLPKKYTRVLDQPNTGEAQPVSKSKSDVQVSAAPPSTQTQKLSVQPMSGMSMQMPFHQPQVPAQFGVPNPQIQLQAAPTSSLPIPIHMEMSIPLLMGNSPMFVQTPNAMQSQGLIHQGQNLNYSSHMGHQMPCQFGSMGIIMAPQFPPQQAAKFTASHKTVKITHPETRGGLQRINSDSDGWQRGTAFQKGLMPYSQTPLQAMHKAEKKYEIGEEEEEEEIKQSQLKAILNKLTSQNFEKMFEQVKQVKIDNVVTLSGLVSQIFDKALKKPTFCEMYANFSFHLAAELPDIILENERITFKRLLLNKCQMEFERGENQEEEANKADEDGQAKHSEEEREEKRLRARRRMLGNIRLIGELYKRRMLTERIMHECIKKLLGQYQNPDEEDIEALCKLMSTIGEMIDHPKAKEHMDAYFDIMAQLSNNMKLCFRVRFMLKDLINLRKNKWQQRRKVERPKKIDEVHRDAAEFGPHGGLQRNNSDSDRWQYGTAFQKGLMPSSQTPVQVMHKAEKKYEVGKVSDEEEIKQRQLKAILNMLTPQNFEKLSEQVKQVNIDNVVTLSGVISQIYDNALMEPTFCEMYANFCFCLAAELPDLIIENERITFKRLLTNKCQEELGRGENEEEANKADEEGQAKQLEEGREEKRPRARRRMLGSIRLLGELYKKRMLTERVMHECIKKLLGQYQNPEEEDVAALCNLMSTIGEMMDHPKAREHMDAYFDIMAQLSNNMKLSSRVRFMLKDSINLRENKWQQRRKVEWPEKFDEVHRDAAQFDRPINEQRGAERDHHESFMADEDKLMRTSLSYFVMLFVLFLFLLLLVIGFILWARPSPFHSLGLFLLFIWLVLNIVS